MVVFETYPTFLINIMLKYKICLLKSLLEVKKKLYIDNSKLKKGRKKEKKNK